MTLEQIIDANHSLQAAGHSGLLDQVNEGEAYEGRRTSAPAIPLQDGDICSFVAPAPRKLKSVVRVSTSATTTILTHNDTSSARAQKNSVSMNATSRTEHELRQLLLQQMQAHKKNKANAVQIKTSNVYPSQKQKDRERHEQELRKRLQASLRTRAVKISAQRSAKVPRKLVEGGNLSGQQSRVTRKRPRGEFATLIMWHRFWILGAQNDGVSACIPTKITTLNFAMSCYLFFNRRYDSSDSLSRSLYIPDSWGRD